MMASRYQVVGPLAVAIVNGKRRTFDRGAVLPEDADQERVAHLLSLGLIAKVEDTKVEDTKVEDTKVEDTKVEDTKVEDTKVEDTKVEDTKVEDTKVEDTKVDIDSLNLEELRKYAKEHEIPLNGARTKPEMRTAIHAAQAELA